MSSNDSMQKWLHTYMTKNPFFLGSNSYLEKIVTYIYHVFLIQFLEDIYKIMIFMFGFSQYNINTVLLGQASACLDLNLLVARWFVVDVYVPTHQLLLEQMIVLLYSYIMKNRIKANPKVVL